jgi:branched-chain amino acid transport system ATP-binding protein
MLEVHDLAVFYGRRPAIQDVALRVDDGESVAILGPNGAGKTTLLRAISGMVRPDRGRICLRGADVTHLRPERLALRGIMHVAEGRRLFRNMTCRENLMLGAFARKPAEARDDLAGLVRIFPELEPKLDLPAGSLSGGQQQMLVIARGLMSRPDLLLLDEPTVGLSPLIVQRLQTILKESARQFFRSLLVVEQNLTLVLSVASRAYVMRNGRIVHEGATADARFDRLAQEYFGIA